MFWFALAAVALSAASAKSSANANNAAGSAAYTDSLKGVTADNQAIQEANLTNTIRTGYKVGLINLQRARTKKQAIEAGFDVSVKGAEGLAETQNNAAASGTVGSSVDAAADNIRKKVDDAQIGIDQSFMEEMLNANLQVEQTVMQGMDALQSSRSVNTTMPKQTNSNTAALMAGASTFASFYASGKLSLGQQTQPTINNAGTYRGLTLGSGSLGLQAPSSSLSIFNNR